MFSWQARGPNCIGLLDKGVWIPIYVQYDALEIVNMHDIATTKTVIDKHQAFDEFPF